MWAKQFQLIKDMMHRRIASSCKCRWNNHGGGTRNVSYRRHENVKENVFCCRFGILSSNNNICIHRNYGVPWTLRKFSSDTSKGIESQIPDTRKFQSLLKEMDKYDIGDIPTDLTMKARKAFETVPNHEANNACLVWERLLEEHISTKRDIVHIDQLNKILSAFQQTASRQVALEAEKIMFSIEKHVENDVRNIPKPTIYSYSLLMDLWAKSPSIDNGERAQKILEKLERDKQVNLVAYNTVLSAWSISTHPKAADYAYSLLRSMTVPPDVVSFSCVIKSWAEQCKRILIHKDLKDSCNDVGGNMSSHHWMDDAWEAAQQAKKIFHEMQTDPYNLTADARCLSAVLDAFSNCATFHNDAAPIGQTLLDQALRDGIQMDENCWDLVLWAWAKSAIKASDSASNDLKVARDAASIASKLLEDIHNLYVTGRMSALPSTRGYAAVIMAHAKAGDPAKAENILRNALALPPIKHSASASLIPISSVNVVLQSWMETFTSDDSLESHPAMKLFRFIQTRSKDQTKTNSPILVAEPDEWSYALVLKSLTKTGTSRNVKELHDEFVEFFSTRPSTADANSAHAVCLTALLEAWCNEENVERADETLLGYTLDSSKAFLLNNSCFHVLLGAWAKHGNPYRARSILHRQKRLFDKSSEILVQPDLMGYGIVMWAFAREGNFECVKDLWEELLETMYGENQEKRQHKDQLLTHCFNALLEALCQARESAKAESLLLENINLYADTSSYSIVLGSWARQSRPREAETLLDRLEQLHQTSNGTIPVPDAYSISAVEHAWAKSSYPNAAERASALLLRRIDQFKKGDHDSKPDTVCFNTTINAWSKSCHPMADQRAIELLELMVDIKCQPDNITFSSVLNTLSKSKRPDRVEQAENLLKQMNELYKNGNVDVKPDTILYNTFISVIGHSDEPNRVEKACSLLDEMDNAQENNQQGVRPDTRTFNSVILCCAYSDGGTTSHHTALHIATEVFSRARSSGQINSFTYDAFFKAIAYLAQKQERIELLQHAFKLCCNDGQLDAMVLKSMERIAPAKELERILPIGQVTGRHIRLDKLPASWSRNRSSQSKGRNTRGRKRM